MRTTTKLTFALTAAFLFTAFAHDADARRNWRRFGKARQSQQRTTQQAQQPATFKQFAEQNQMPCAMHNGKLFIKVDGSKLQQNLESYCKIGNGKVLEFQGKGHLHTRYNTNKDADFITRLSNGTFRPPYSAGASVVVKLTDNEHRELNAYVDAAHNDARSTIGSFNYNGGLPKRYYPSSSKANCTSWISSAKLDGRQSLARSCGVWDAASPTGWIKSLVSRGNSRVEAVLLHQFNGDVNNLREINSFINTTMVH